MKFLVESHARALFSFLAAALAGSLLAAELLAWQNGPTLCLPLLAVFGVLGLCVLGGCGAWFRWQERTLEQAVDYAKSIYGSDDIIWYNQQGGRRPHAAAAYAVLSGSRSAMLPNPYTAEEAAAA